MVLPEMRLVHGTHIQPQILLTYMRNRQPAGNHNLRHQITKLVRQTVRHKTRYHRNGIKNLNITIRQIRHIRSNPAAILRKAAWINNIAILVRALSNLSGLSMSTRVRALSSSIMRPGKMLNNLIQKAIKIK